MLLTRHRWSGPYSDMKNADRKIACILCPKWFQINLGRYISTRYLGTHSVLWLYIQVSTYHFCCYYVDCRYYPYKLRSFIFDSLTCKLICTMQRSRSPSIYLKGYNLDSTHNKLIIKKKNFSLSVVRIMYKWIAAQSELYVDRKWIVE